MQINFPDKLYEAMLKDAKAKGLSLKLLIVLTMLAHYPEADV
jgi:hypothetical protein